MGIFNNEFIVNKENPFENDKLNRQKEIVCLTSLFGVVDRQMVLAINSPWGYGKTTFLKMWKAHLDIQGYSTVFFNSWKNDFVEEPFIAFIEEIRSQLKNGIVDKEFIDKSKEVGIFLLKGLPSIGAKYIENKTGIDINSATSYDEISQLVSDKMEAYKKAKNSIEKFKKELEKISAKNYEDTHKPIVIFIDELDRCRPDFAICLLERIKHFFNLPNIIFILGIDKEALSNSIKVVYGNGTDINGYLTRFIDMEYSIKQEYTKEYIKFLLEKYPFKEVFKSRKSVEGPFVEGDYEEFKVTVIEILSVFNLSLRDLEKLIVNLYLIVKANEKNYLIIYPVLFLLIIKKINKSLFDRIKNKDINVKDIISILDKKYTFSAWLNNYLERGYVMEAYLIILLYDNERINTKRNRIKELEGKIDWNDSDVLCVNAYDSIKRAYIFYDIENIFKHSIERVQMYNDYKF